MTADIPITPITVEAQAKNYFSSTLAAARQQTAPNHNPKHVDVAICNVDELLAFVEEAHDSHVSKEHYRSQFTTPHPDDDNTTIDPPAIIVSNVWFTQIREANTQFDRAVLFIIAALVIKKGEDGAPSSHSTGFIEFHKQLLSIFPQVALYLRNTFLQDTISTYLQQWQTFTSLPSNLATQLGKIIKDNEQPEEEQTQFLKKLKTNFDSMRFLRMLAKMEEMEQILNQKEKLLYGKNFAVYADTDDIDKAKRNFIGSVDTFERHFENHAEAIEDYQSSLEKFLRYQRELAVNFPDALRYFQLLYTESKSIAEAYERFDQRVSKQMVKLDAKLTQFTEYYFK